MKNIHILPTDKPTGIFKSGDNLLFSIMNKVRTTHEGFHIYITSDKKIKEGDWFYNIVRGTIQQYVNQDRINDDNWKKIILTTDQDLDGVQAIDDEFLEWFVKNPSCESVEVIPLRKSSGHYDEKEIWNWDFLAYKIIIPKEEITQNCIQEAILNNGAYEYEQQGLEKYSYELEPKQETLEEAFEKWADQQSEKGVGYDKEDVLKFGAKWQAKRMYSEEDMKLSHRMGAIFAYGRKEATHVDRELHFKEWFEQFKKK